MQLYLQIVSIGPALYGPIFNVSRSDVYVLNDNDNDDNDLHVRMHVQINLYTQIYY